MKLLLMRHGEAEPHARTDSDRALTNFGREQVTLVAQALLRMDMVIDKAMVSPYLRARQTAEIMTSTMGGCWPEEISDAITPDRAPELATRALSDGFETTETGLVVMHQPIISRLVYYLTGQDQHMGTAALAVIQAPEFAPGYCELECVI